MPTMTTSATTMRTGISHSHMRATPFEVCPHPSLRRSRASAPRRLSQPLLTEDALEIGVLEHAPRVETVAECDEVVESGIAITEDRGIQIVHLAPVRATAEGQHDLL